MIVDPTDRFMESVLSNLRQIIKEDACNQMTEEYIKPLARELRRLQACICRMANAPLDLFGADCVDFTRIVFNKVDSSLLGISNPILQNWDYSARIIEAITAKINRTFTGMQHLYKDEKEAQVTDLVGMDGPRELLIKMLAEGDDMSMKIVSIVGSQGLGKTTLAQVVYNQLKHQFDCVAFVRAPLQQGMSGFFTELICQLDAQNHMNTDYKTKDESQLLTHIGEFLQDKRYLVVIDDLWNEEDWPSISRSLPSNGHGSRVITTTRFNNVAKVCCSGSDKTIHQIQRLGYPDSKRLFLKQFFGSDDVSCHNAPMDVFVGILKMCGGTPSAIISIALFLATEVTATKSWQEMMNSVHSAWNETPTMHEMHENISGFEDLRRILSIAYLHLPSTLMNCLLYLAIYSKDQMIHRTTMVRKWITEGFISGYVRCSHEEVANRYFDELIDRNFIQVVKCVGEEIYLVNNMMIYILRLISQQEQFASVLSDTGISMELAHPVRLFVQCSHSEFSVVTDYMDLSRIRSITIVGPAKFYLTNDMLCLRVLDLDGCKGLDNSAMDHICGMNNLKYLSLKHTQVTKIPPKIRELQKLKTLDIRQTEISNLPPEIGELQELKTLDARWTQISCVPPEIGKLQNLETLDVRHTQVKELRKEIFELPKLAHLYYGRSSSPRGVKLPAGSDKWTSVKVPGIVDSREWSGSDMEEIRWPTEVRELEVVLHDQPGEKDLSEKLLSSLAKCKNLEYLIICGDYNPSNDALLFPSFPLLEEIKVAGRFVKVPRWIAQLTTLKKLDVRVCKLDQDDLKILGGLLGLSTLALALICIPRKKEVAITSRLHSRTCTDLPPLEETCPAGFRSLEIFSFDCRVPWITFEQGAMPRLKNLYLKLYAFPAGKFPSGITNLHSLEKIILQYSSEYASSGGVTKVVSAMREEASSHRNLIDLSVNGYHEDFPPNARVEETITGNEIKEDSNHGNPIEISANGEVLDTMVDKTTTATETEEASNHGNLVEPSVDGDREVLLSNTRVDETITGTEIKECY